MLKFKVDKAAFDAMPEDIKKEYTASGDGYTLSVEGAVDKSKLDEFRANNQQLNEKLSKFSGVNLDEWNTLKELERKAKDKELIDAGKIDELLDQKVSVIKSDYENQLSAVNSKLEIAEGNTSKLLNKYEIDGAAMKAITENKIRPEAADAVSALVKSKFILENGVAVSKDDKGNIIAGANGNLTISEFVASQPDGLKIQSNGGGGPGGMGGAPQGGEKTTRQKIADGLAARKMA